MRGPHDRPDPGHRPPADIFVLADASADPVPGVHEFLTEKIFPRQAGVVTTAELEQLLTAGSASS